MWVIFACVLVISFVKLGVADASCPAEIDKPAFFVSLKKSPYTLTGINDVIKFDDVRVNRGGGYNAATGVFTAPRSGLYHISCMILGQVNHVVHYQLNKNDAGYTMGYSTRGQGLYSSSTISVLMHMEEGDWAFIKHRHTSSPETIIGGDHSTFAGYFLSK